MLLYAESDTTFLPRKGTAIKIRTVSLADFKIPVANYSGIARLDKNRFAVVSDKEDGFYIFQIKTNEKRDNIISCSRGDLLNNPYPGDLPSELRDSSSVAAGVSAGDSSSVAESVTVSKIPYIAGNVSSAIRMNIINGRDCEGIVYVPSSATLFISGEEDQRIIEYDTLGTPTGRELAVPEIFSRQNICPNYGFESLAYDPSSGRFYTTTENTLPADGPVASPLSRVAARLRIQSFNRDLQPTESYAYMTDIPVSKTNYSHYAFGVPAMYALSKDTLLVLEREFYVGKGIEVMNSYVVNKLYSVVTGEEFIVKNGELLSERPQELFLPKTLVYEWITRISNGIANYEGMCLGENLPGGRRMLYLINDSQAGYKGVLKEFIMMLAL